MTEPIQDELRKGLRRLQVATVVLFLALAGLIAYVLVTALSTQDALCSLRGNNERQASLTQRILDTHPGKAVIFGIPRALYTGSVANQQRTVDALSNLNCSKGG